MVERVINDFWQQKVPSDEFDELVAIWKEEMDVSLLLQNLTLTPIERLRKLEELREFVNELRNAERLGSSGSKGKSEAI